MIDGFERFQGIVPAIGAGPMPGRFVVASSRSESRKPPFGTML
ncbi:hypothetical protein F8B43_5125 [Methylorubrum populi]|uniref:Uncharacterized protein n=1 Tax=Methylorubrum populi TaxID=223967 RepID=A0A833MZ76_9HYPH|nr:hypothetical protein F8B43_5125 [Methylorubrum populi]